MTLVEFQLAAPVTLSAIATLMTGLDPTEHGARYNGYYELGGEVEQRPPGRARAALSPGRTVFWQVAATGNDARVESPVLSFRVRGDDVPPVLSRIDQTACHLGSLPGGVQPA